MRFAAIAVILVLSPPALAGQAVAVDTTPSLLVIVRDTAGRPINQAKIDVVYVGDTTERHISAVTDSMGRSFLGRLAPGGCRVSVRAIGKTSMIWNRMLRPGATDTLKLVMGGRQVFHPSGRTSPGG